MIALIIGTVLLVLSVTLYIFSTRQYTGMQTIVKGEIAHFLAETGINTTIGTIRESITTNLSNNGASSQKLKELLLNTNSLDNLCINHLLSNDWNKDLEAFSKEVDKTASIDVSVYLRDFKATESNPSLWNDPKAARGWLVIESVGSYGGIKRKIMIKRALSIFNMVPGVMSKFSLYLDDAIKRSDKDFNLIRNDYKGMVTDGPKPLMVYNHTTPDNSFEPVNLADTIEEEKEPNIWKNRGWIWLKGEKCRLNLCSGAGDLGEIFHFYDVSNSNKFTPIRFQTPIDKLPEAFFKSLSLPWDKSAAFIKTTGYRFWHSFILDAFHDKSSRSEKDAMYEGDILSIHERKHYGAKSSILHLYGDARKGYQSRTRVIGPVYSAFIRFANLDVKPEDEEVKRIFESHNPKPIYLLRSLPYSNYNDSVGIREFAGRHVGGPILKSGMLFKDYNQYQNLMSAIVELPYNQSYNTMQEVYDNKANRCFPSDKKVLDLDLDGQSEISRGKHIFYKGSPKIHDSIMLIESRIQRTLATPADFWKSYLNDEGELELNSVVAIENSRGEEFVIPPVGLPQPLKVKGGGIILLRKGNISLRGIALQNSSEILTLAATAVGSIRFESTQENQVSIIAPNYEVEYGSRFSLYGSLCAKGIYADHRFQGGTIKYRASQDPTKASYDKFYKVFIANNDSYWYE